MDCVIQLADDALRVLELRGQANHFTTVAWSPCGTMLATGLHDNTDSVCVWRVSDGECLRVLKDHANDVRSVAWSPCSKYLATGSDADRTARVWRLDVSNDVSKDASDDGTSKDSECIQVLRGHTGWVLSVAWSPCSNYLVTGSNDGTARVWLASTGECLKVLKWHISWIRSVAWSPCGAMLATGSGDSTARVWRCDVSNDVSDGTSKDGECLHVLRGHTSCVFSVAWSPLLADGSIMLATGSWDCTARVWLASTGKCLKVLEGHTASVYSVAWSPLLADGSSTLATGSVDGTTRVWRFDASVVDTSKSGQCLKVLKGHTNSILSVAWSPVALQGPANGNMMLATNARPGTVCIWTLCSWTPRTHRRFTPAARQLVLRIMCARQRLHGRVHTCVPPLEIWILIFGIIFRN